MVPCNIHHHGQWQHGMNQYSSLLSSRDCQKPIYTSSDSADCPQEIKSPEPKPRWNPNPEQIRILEANFNSGTVNPPRDEIQRIRAHLQEYGQVRDANVFYWFQNRKSRSKHKRRRHLHCPPTDPAAMPAGPTVFSAAPGNQTTCRDPLLESFYLPMGPVTWSELLLGDSKVDKLLRNPNPSILSGLDLGPAGGGGVPCWN